MTKELLKLTLEAIELHLLHHEHGCVYLDPVVFKIKDALQEPQRMAKRIEDLVAKRESAYQRGYLDGIGRECPHCKDYKAMYIKVRDELAAEQQVTQQQTARIVDLQTHIENLEGED